MAETGWAFDDRWPTVDHGLEAATVAAAEAREVCGEELVEVFFTARPRGLSHFSEELGENSVESLGIFPEHHVAAKDLHP